MTKESGIRAVKPELLDKIAKALEVSEGALKDYGVETAQDLMALLLQLEEGYGLVPSEDGMAVCVQLVVAGLVTMIFRV